MGLTLKEVYERLKEGCPGAVVEIVEPSGEAYAVVEPSRIVEVCRFLRDTVELDFDYPSCISGVDDLKNLWVVYHLYSVRRNHRAVLKVKLDRENPAVSSVCGVWSGANWHEREAYDMYGIVFEGHPDPRRILLPEDWPGYPMRKDYDFPEHYQGIPLK
ncbi:MAG: NADH-quinone oxidoreductase subunit C [Planctomycetes bacterium]|nr:NADH-quinone oxidoreductase subunit C [Planctomycetota bacterium]